MNEVEGLTLASYVKSSQYRYRVMGYLNEKNLSTPTDICKGTGILINHISNVLRQLKEHGLIECLNEDSHKGRLYRITDNGYLVLNDYLNKI